MPRGPNKGLGDTSDVPVGHSTSRAIFPSAVELQIHKFQMYLINSCASCAAPLEPTDVKKCSRCKTRYCSATCARDHWKKRGGHKTTCEEIAADGGAERSYVINKYAEAIAEARMA